MRRTAIISVLGLAFLLVFTSASPAIGQASTKPQGKAARAADTNPWANFNPGAWVQIKSVTVKDGQAMNQVETKITLLEKTADKVVLQNDMTVNGQTTTTKAEFPVKGYTGDALPPGVTLLKSGSETLAVAGRSVACDTRETSMDMGGTKILSKTWTSKQVPGSLVKSVTTSGGRESTAEVVDFKAL